MCVLPELYADEGLTRLDRFKVSMCISDALDLAAESSFENIVFTHWPIASYEQSAEILLLCLAHWIRYSVYFDRVRTLFNLSNLTFAFSGQAHKRCIGRRGSIWSLLRSGKID